MWYIADSSDGVNAVVMWTSIPDMAMIGRAVDRLTVPVEYAFKVSLAGVHRIISTRSTTYHMSGSLWERKKAI